MGKSFGNSFYFPILKSFFSKRWKEETIEAAKERRCKTAQEKLEVVEGIGASTHLLWMRNAEKTRPVLPIEGLPDGQPSPGRWRFDQQAFLRNVHHSTPPRVPRARKTRGRLHSPATVVYAKQVRALHRRGRGLLPGAVQLGRQQGKVPCSLNPPGCLQVIPIGINLFLFVISISCREASPLKVKYTLDRKSVNSVDSANSLQAVYSAVLPPSLMTFFSSASKKKF